MQNNGLKDSIDYSALDNGVTQSDTNTFLASGGKKPMSGWLFLSAISIFFILLFTVGVLFGVVGELFKGRLALSDLNEYEFVFYTVIFFGVLLTISLFLNDLQSRKNLAKLVRTSKFAAANNMTYIDTMKKSSNNGLIFSQGQERSTYDVVTSQSSPVFSFGTHRYITGGGRGRSSNEYGYISIDVGRGLPHTIFDAKANNGKLFDKQLFTNLPTTFDKDQIVSVNPEIDAVYTVYSSEKDVSSLAQIMTTNVFNKLKSLSFSFDIEMVGQNVYVYKNGAFKETKEAIVEIMELIDLIQAAFKVSYDPEVISSTAKTQVNTNNALTQRLKGRAPRYIAILAYAAVIIQFFVLIYQINN